MVETLGAGRYSQRGRSYHMTPKRMAARQGSVEMWHVEPVRAGARNGWERRVGEEGGV